MLDVIVPTYNRPAYLLQCLQSIAKSTVPMKVLVADDHSEESLFDVLDPFVGDGTFGYIHRPKNLGALANVTQALDVTYQKYICVVPDDDSVNDGNFERKLDILEAHPEVGFVYSRAYIMDAETRILGVADRPEFMRQSYIGGRQEFLDLLSGNWIYGASVVFRRSLYEWVGYQDELMPSTLGDWDCWLRYASKMQTAYINEPLVNTRLHAGALSQVEESGMATAMLTVWQKWLLDNPTPPVLDPRRWQAMRAVFEGEVNRLLTSSLARRTAYEQFDWLHTEYQHKLGERFDHAVRLDAIRPEFEAA